ncbi:Tn5253 hypothetical protein [Streptococcus pneumoniae]|nr:Tn5253 hypothetical protein [Streptococcus pneumoniae]
MAERFWENLSIILAERNISWIELTYPDRIREQ